LAGAQARLVWRMAFDEKSNPGLAGEDETGVYEFVDGALRVRTKKGMEGAIQTELEFDRTKDYRIETRISPGLAERPSGYVGLVWDWKTDNDYYILFVGGDRKFFVGRILGGVYKDIVPKESLPALSLAGELELAVERKADRLDFYIGGIRVKSLAHEGLNSRNFSVIFGGEQTVVIRRIAVYAERPYSGETLEREPGFKTIYDSPLDKASAPWLSSSGSLKGSWDAQGRPEPGYTLSHEERGFADSLTTRFEFDPARDFAILARIRFLSGDLDYGYGIVVDKRGEDQLRFLVSGDGHFSLARVAAGKKTDILPWTKNPNVEKYESANTLGIFRKKDKLLFSINGRLVHEMDYEEWLSTDLGVTASGSMKIRPLSLAIYQAPFKAGPKLGDCMNGFGIYEYADGSKRVGYWKDGKQEGYGTYYKADGSIWDTVWKEGEFYDSWLADEEKPTLYYPVETGTGIRGLVDASGAPQSWGLGASVALGEPVESMVPLVTKEGLGFRDASGTERSSASWNLLSAFHEGRAIISGGKNTTGLIYESGTVLVQPGSYVFEPSSRFSSGVIPYKTAADTTGLYGLMGANGQIVRRADLLDLKPFVAGLAAAKAKNGLYGYLDKTGAWRILPRFQKAESFSEGVAYARIDGRDIYIDTEGEHLLAFDFDQSPGKLNAMRYNLIPFFRNGEYLGFMDERGERVFEIEEECSDYRLFSGGLAAFRSSTGAWGFVDTEGFIPIAPRFEDAGSFVSGLAPVREGKLWGYIEPDGSWSIKPRFAEARDFLPEGFAQVKTKGGSWTWIDRSGRLIWEDEGRARLEFSEDFKDNSRSWPVGKNQSIQALVQNGYYLVTTFQETGDIAPYALPFDRAKDYSLAATIRYNTKSYAEAVGLVWDLKDGSSMYIFAISPQGGYAIIRIGGGTQTMLEDWTAEPAVRTGIRDNIVEVRKSGDQLRFIINEKTVATLPYETCSGSKIGIACLGKTSAVVESIWLWRSE
ncbi:MAG TPA: WG repeat-containing protein, partial [Rectinemataceae bacterium]